MKTISKHPNLHLFVFVRAGCFVAALQRIVFGQSSATHSEEKPRKEKSADCKGLRCATLPAMAVSFLRKESTGTCKESRDFPYSTWNTILNEVVKLYAMRIMKYRHPMQPHSNTQAAYCFARKCKSFSKS